MGNKAWSDNEKCYLHNAWGELAIKKIAKELGRSVDAVRIKAWKIGLNLNSYNDYISCRFAGIMIGVNTKKIIEWVKRRGLPCKPVVKKSKIYWNIKYDCFIRFLRLNQDLWDSRKVEPYALGQEYDWLKAKRETDRLIMQNAELGN
jgi:hypothetical protein